MMQLWFNFGFSFCAERTQTCDAETEEDGRPTAGGVAGWTGQ